MAVYLKITDGTTTIDLLGNDATNSFNLIEGSWAPNVARRKRSQMGGGSWAEDVVEALPLYAKSDTSAATVLANIDALAALMDQAQRWALGEAVDPVILRYSPNSSTVYVQAVILGPPDNAQAVVLPPTFTDDLHQNDVVKGVTLQFKRRGLWHATQTTVAGSDTSTVTPDTTTRTFAAAVTNPSPTDFSIEFTSASSPTAPYANLVVAVTDDANNIVIVPGENLTKRDSAGGPVTTTADAAARGGNVKRFNGGNGGYYDTSVNSAKRIIAILSCRNNSTTTPVTVKLQAASVSWGAFNSGKQITVDTSTTNPRVVILPMVALPEAISRVCIDVSGASFDIDDAVFINVDSIGTRVLTSVAAAANENGIKTWFLNRSLTDPIPLVKNTNSAGSQTDYTPWYGDRNIYLSGDEISVMVMGINSSNFYLTTGGSTAASYKLADVSRLPVYLVPR
jgi:hypothetical protein